METKDFPDMHKFMQKSGLAYLTIPVNERKKWFKCNKHVKNNQIVSSHNRKILGYIVFDGPNVRVVDTTAEWIVKKCPGVKPRMVWSSLARWNNILTIGTNSGASQKTKITEWECKYNHANNFTKDFEFRCTSESAPQKVKLAFIHKATKKFIDIPLKCFELFQILDELTPICKQLPRPLFVLPQLSNRSLKGGINSVATNAAGDDAKAKVIDLAKGYKKTPPPPPPPIKEKKYNEAKQKKRKPTIILKTKKPKKKLKKNGTIIEKKNNPNLNQYGIRRKKLSENDRRYLHECFFENRFKFKFHFQMDLRQQDFVGNFNTCFICRVNPLTDKHKIGEACHIIPFKVCKSEKEQNGLHMFIPGCKECNKEQGDAKNALFVIYNKCGTEVLFRIVSILRRIYEEKNKNSNPRESLVDWVRVIYHKPFKNDNRGLAIDDIQFWVDLANIENQHKFMELHHQMRLNHGEMDTYLKNKHQQMERYMDKYQQMMLKDHQSQKKLLGKI